MMKNKRKPLNKKPLNKKPLNKKPLNKTASLPLNKNPLNKTASLLVIGLVIFALHYVLMFVPMQQSGEYDMRGKWTLVPHYEVGVNQTGSPFTRAYNRLLGWDGQWYYDIARRGYVCAQLPETNNPHVCNLGFFPLVSMTGSFLSWFGVDLIFAVPLVAQAAWLGSILLFLLLLRQAGGGTIAPMRLLPLLLLVAYPGTLFLFTPHSESLVVFFLMLVAFLSYSQLHSPTTAKLLALSAACFVASLTKVTGVMGVAIPILLGSCAFLAGGVKRKTAIRLVVLPALCGLLGLVSFLVYCQVVFGDWAIYFKSVGSGWGVFVEGAASGGGRFFNLSAIYTGFQWHDYLPIRFTKSMILAVVPMIVLLAVAQWRHRNTASILCLALPLFSIVLVSYWLFTIRGYGPESLHRDFLRQFMPAVALMMLMAALLMQPPKNGLLRSAIVLFYGLAIALCGFWQYRMLGFFAQGRWVG